MKVLHVFKTYLPDGFAGVEHVIWELAEGTSKLGIDAEVFTLSSSPSSKPIAIGHHTVHQAKLDAYVASTGLSLSAFPKFRALASGADIIHYHFPWPFMDLLHLYARPKARTIVTYHSDIVRQKSALRLYRPLMHAFLNQVDSIVATSPNYATGSDVLAQYPSKLAVIPIGLSERITPRVAVENSWRHRVGNDFLLFVGALRYYKGVSFLLEAARISNVPVVIAGDGEFKSEIERAGLPNVTVVGEIDDESKEALLTLSRGFVFPSHLRSEAFGVALLEAARAGKAMISCEIGTGTTFINLDGITGLTVAPMDAAALATAMRRLWESPELSEAFGVAARERYLTEFRATQMSEQYVAEYNRLLSDA